MPEIRGRGALIATNAGERAVRYTIRARQEWVRVPGDDPLPGLVDVVGWIEAEGGDLMLFPFFEAENVRLRLEDGSEIPASYFGGGEIRFTETKRLAKYFPGLLGVDEEPAQ